MAAKKLNPFKVAREAIEEAYGDQIGELCYTVQNELKNGVYEIFKAVNPRIEELEKEHTRLWEKAEKQGQRKLAAEFDDNWGSRRIIWEDSFFVLGIAFALRMKGGE